MFVIGLCVLLRMTPVVHAADVSQDTATTLPAEAAMSMDHAMHPGQAMSPVQTMSSDHTMDMDHGQMLNPASMLMDPMSHASTADPNASIFSIDRILEHYVPRQECMFYEPDVIWTNAISDAVIALSYYSIPLALFFFVRKRKDLEFKWVFVLFALFILACGTTHIMSVIAIWHPYYRLDGWIKAVTAAVSLVTAILLWPLMPRALALAGPSAMREANQKLQTEIAERHRAEAELRLHKDQLEVHVTERTSELAEANARLRAEVEARKMGEAAQAKLAVIVETSEDAIIGKNLDGTITSWNHAAQRMFGFSAQEIIGQSILRIVPPDLAQEEHDLLARLSAGQRITHYETTRRTRDGRDLSISLSVSPIRDRLGIMLGVSTIARDVTEQHRAEKERERLLAQERIARAEAERSNRIKDEFLATLGHELRTPLNAILGWAQLLRRPNNDAETLKQGLETIERNARAQTQLIHDLLDMSRIVAGKTRLEMKLINLGEVVQAAMNSIQPAAQAKEILLQKNFPKDVPLIRGDAGRLQQVIWNLLTNAIKFTPREGRVSVSIFRQDSNIQLTVADTGQGISPDFLPHVFEQFRQGDSSTTRKHGGLGLGLSIVKSLVEMHGGSVQVQSPGFEKGAIFTVNLPIPAIVAGEESADTSSAVQYQGPTVSLSDLRILVVDDVADARELVRHWLSSAGATVTTAIDAPSALAIYKEKSFDVVVSDLGMPGEDGYVLLRQIREVDQQAGRITRAIALTAFARAEDRARTMLAGFMAHLAKPVNPDELLSTIAHVARIQPEGPGDDKPTNS